MMEKVANLRIMADADGRFNLSVLDAGGQVLLISQFTLYAGTRRGRRPSFTDSAPAEVAELLFERSAALLKEQGLNVEMGRFRQHMMVELVNDGPVTIMLDSADREQPRRG
jgi:D-tyrosyl-tRNA(Tyr) deacylase